MKTLKYYPCANIFRKFVSCLLAFLMVNVPVWALSSSDVTGMSSGATLNGTAPANTVSFHIDGKGVVDWSKLNVDMADAINTLEFENGSSKFAVLNRVMGDVNFNGFLNAVNGKVYIVSPYSITIGAQAVITAEAFTASGMDIQNQDFLENVEKFVPFADGKVGNVINNANINDIQQVNLLGKTVLNTGNISVPEGGVVLMAAGDSVKLGEPGGNVLVEMSGITDGKVTNSGSITAPAGTIILAAGDIYTTALGLTVFDGAGKIEQNGTLSADSMTGDAGNITMAGQEVTLSSGSVTSVNAAPGSDTDRFDGGEILISSIDAVHVSPEAFLSAKGNGWYDVDDNRRFDEGIDTDYSGRIRIAGKYLYLPSASDYDAPVELLNHIDLVGYMGGQLESGILTIGNNEGDLTVANGLPAEVPAANTVYEDAIESFSNLGIHIDVLSAGNIAINNLNTDNTSDLGLLGGSGNISLRTMFDNGGIMLSDKTDIIGTTDGGDIFMLAGNGGINVGQISITNDNAGDPGQVLLFTSNGGDIETGNIHVQSGNHEIVSVISSGDININGGIDVNANEVPDSDDKTVTSEVCLVAGDDIDITGSINAEAHGKVSMETNIHIDAGADPLSNDDGESQAGIITIDLNGGQIRAKAEASGPDPEGTNDLYSEATVEIHTSAVDTELEQAINIFGGKSGGNQAVQVRANVQGGNGFDSSMPAADPTSYSETETDTTKGGINRTAFVLVDIQSNYDVQDCADCPKPPFLPPQPKFFLVKDDIRTVSWRTGLTIDGTNFDTADIDVLLNDNGKDGSDNLIPLYDSMIVIESLDTEKGGKLEWVQFQYTDDQGITHTYDGFVYTAPSNTTANDFFYDGATDANGDYYASFTDSFVYQGKIGEDLSLNKATVTLIVTNYLPEAGDTSGSVHMSTSTNPTSVDVPLVITDQDGSPNPLSINVGTATNGSTALDGTKATYNPDDIYIGSDSFNYSVSDTSIKTTGGQPVEDSATISIDVTNETPTAGDSTTDNHMGLIIPETDLDAADTPDSVNGTVDPGITDPITVVLLDGNGDPVTGNTFTTVLGGVVTLIDNGDGTFSYTYDAPDGVAATSDSFNYVVKDPQGLVNAESQTGTITINLTNETPTAGDSTTDNHMGLIIPETDLDAADTPDSVNGTVDPGITDPITVVLLDGDGNPVTGNTFTTALGGVVTLIDNGDGTFSYTYDAPDGVAATSDSFNYVVKDPQGLVNAESQTGTITINLTNETPTAGDSTTDNHMGLIIPETDLDAADTPDSVNGTVDPGITDPITVVLLDGNGDPVTGNTFTTALGGVVTLIDNGDGTFSYTYDAPDGVAATSDSFNYVVKDPQGLVNAESQTGTITINLTNVGPIAGDDSSSTDQGVPVTINILINDDDQFDTVNGTFDPGFKDLPLTIKILEVTGGSAKYNEKDGTITFTPDPGFTGVATIKYEATDGGKDYSGEIPMPFVDTAVVTITIKGDTPNPDPEPEPQPLPTPALNKLEVPQIKGCPALMDAAASELAINTDDLQVMFSIAMASNPNLQPCDACEKIVDSSNVLKDTDGLRLAALSQIFNTLAPADAPFTPEVQASVAAAFADMAESDPQYAMAVDYIDAFVSYVATLQNDLKMPVGDPMAVVLDKYGQQIVSGDNPNIAAYIMAQLNSAEVAGEGAM